MGRDLLEAALRVLNACSSGNPPDAADINKLRESADGRDCDLAPDVLAARMIQREIERGRRAAPCRRAMSAGG